MRVTVLYFAGARDAAGVSEEPIELESEATIARALAVVVAKHPALAPHVPRLRVARNETFAQVEDGLEDGDVLAIIPPVAGG
jgi:molybdopterin converting factor subunit 1